MGRDKRTAKLPVLNDIRIASPCSEAWDGMVGDDRVRFCGGCMKNVYNLSAMTSSEAEEVIAEKEGNLCVRLYRRKDGTVITSDCPVGVRRKRVTKIAAAALALGGAGLALAMVDATPQPCEIPTETTRPARKAPRTKAAPFWTKIFTPEATPEATPEMGEPEMGDFAPTMGSAAPVAPPSPPPSSSTNGTTEQPPQHPVMGRMVAPPVPDEDKVPEL